MHKKPGLNLSLSISMPTPEVSKAHARPSVMEKIDECLTMVESGHESQRHLEYLARLNNCLMKKPSLTPKQAKVLKMIQPAMKKYGRAMGVEQDTERLVEIDALKTPAFEVDQARKRSSTETEVDQARKKK